MIEWSDGGNTYRVLQDKVTAFVVRNSDGIVTLKCGGDEYVTTLKWPQVASILQGHAQA